MENMTTWDTAGVAAPAWGWLWLPLTSIGLLIGVGFLSIRWPRATQRRPVMRPVGDGQLVAR